MLLFVFTLSEQINENTNVQLNNIVIQTLTPCLSQGVVRAADQASSTILMEVFPNYPTPDNPWFQEASEVKVLYWNSSTQHLIVGQNIVDNWINGTAVPGQPNLYNITLKHWTYTPAVGDWVSAGPRIGQAALHLSLSGQMTFNNVSIMGCGNIALIEVGGYGNNTYNNFQVQRPSTAPLRLLACNAGGVNADNAMYGPHFVNSYFEFCGDDFINIHNSLVCKQLVWRAFAYDLCLCIRNKLFHHVFAHPRTCPSNSN